MTRTKTTTATTTYALDLARLETDANALLEADTRKGKYRDSIAGYIEELIENIRTTTYPLYPGMDYRKVALAGIHEVYQRDPKRYSSPWELYSVSGQSICCNHDIAHFCFSPTEAQKAISRCERVEPLYLLKVQAERLTMAWHFIIAALASGENYWL